MIKRNLLQALDASVKRPRPKTKEAWILDAGATAHTTSTIHGTEDFVESENHRASTASDETLRVVGKGTVKRKDRTERPIYQEGGHDIVRRVLPVEEVSNENDDADGNTTDTTDDSDANDVEMEQSAEEKGPACGCCKLWGCACPLRLEAPAPSSPASTSAEAQKILVTKEVPAKQRSRRKPDWRY